MPGPSRQPPASSSPVKNTVPAAPVVASVQPAVNRKKAKRRAKEAAKRAGTGSNPADPASPPISPPVQNGDLHVPGAFDQAYDPQGYLGDDGDVDDDGESDHGELDYSQQDLSSAPRSKSKKKRKNRKASESIDGYDTFTSNQAITRGHTAPPISQVHEASYSQAVSSRNSHKVVRDRIWNTSTAEERENIKEFWLQLEEVERRSLVKVEKEAVLKKMKEQQKHSCSCSVCGRKRTAIEEELEVLYDAYYDELEQYANHQVVLEDGTVITGREAAQLYPPLPTARLAPLVGQNGPQSRFQEEPDDEDDLTQEEGYSDEEEGYDDDYSDAPPQSAVEFFNFGNSLTVQGGILTVADDLLKNDGKKFIEMMEQLAERRMQREEEAQYVTQGLRYPNSAYRPHEPPLDDDQYDDDDEYATDDDEYDQEEEEEEPVGEVNLEARALADFWQEGLTEEQRMEEGRRMFQIFAARMFEQRVLTAYREKVARERQEKLLEELEEEQNKDARRDEKKAKEAAKKKQKKLAQKARLDEEKQRKDAEKQAAEAALKAEEERKAEESRLKREEQKRKKEEEKRRQEEEKLRKEEQRQKKLADARKAQEDADRKQKEQKERDRVKREEAKQKEREEKEAKDKHAKERRDREAAEKQERDARVKAEKMQTKESTRKAEQAQKVTAQAKAAPPPALLRKQTSNVSAGQPVVQSIAAVQASAQPSPHLQIATPVIPKAPSPARPRQASQQGSMQGSHQSSPKSSQVPSGSSATSPSTTQQGPASSVQLPKPHAPHQMQPGFQQTRHLGQVPGPPPGMSFPMSGAPGMQPNGFPPYGSREPAGFSGFPPGFDTNMHGGNHFGAPFRSYPGPNGMSQFPPGLNGMRPIGSGPPAHSPSSATSPHPPTGPLGHQVPAPVGQRGQGHSRQPSASFDRATDSTPAQPIGPPQHLKRQSSGPDETGKQLGSSALLGDDEPEEPARDIPGRSMPQAPFGGGSSSSTMFQRPFGHNNTPFGTPSIGGFGQSPSMPNWAHSNGTGSWGAAKESFAPFGGRQHHNPVLLRQRLCASIKNLNSSPHTQTNAINGFQPLDAVTREVNTMARQSNERVSPNELLDLCDTLGSASNGGGVLTVGGDEKQGYWIRFEDDSNDTPLSARGSIGDMGGQLPPHAQMMHGHQQPHQGGGSVLPLGIDPNGPFSGNFGQPVRRGQ